MKFRLTPVAAALTAMFAVPSVALAQDAPAAAPVAETAPAAPAAEAAKPAERAVQLPAVKVVGQQDTPKAERVSSPKFTEPLLNTPQTIQVIKKEVLQQQAATSLTEALRNVPGITFTAGENGNTQSGDTVFMRGFDTQGSIFLDNIRDLGTAVRDVFNVEQIEIVKGPAGADNGRGAASGYINLASKVPVADDFIAGTLSYGTADKRRITADLNEQIGDNTAVRLNLMGQDGGVAGRDFIERQSWGVAPSIAFGLGTSTRAYLFSQHIRQNNTPDGLVPTFGLDGYTLNNSPDRPFEQTLAAAGITPRPVDSSKFWGSKDDFEDIEANMMTVKFEHDLSPTTTIRNLSRYGRSEQDRVLTAPGAPTVTNGTPGTAGTATAAPTAPNPPLTARDPDDFTVARTRHFSFRTNDILTNQTSFSTNFDTGPLKHTMGGGLEFLYEKQVTPTYALPAGTSVPAVNLYNPDRNLAVPALVRNGAGSDGQTTTSATYLFDTVKLNEQWQLNAMLRFEHYRTETNSVSIASATNNTVPAVPNGTLIPLRVEDSDNLFSWKVGALFKPVPNGSVYVAFANSLKPPGGDNFSLVADFAANGTPNANVNSPALDPQKATNIEVGAKWDFLDGKLATTAALFRSENENDLARLDGNEVIQYGEKKVEGIELGLVGLITNDWTVSFGLTKQDTEVTEGTFAAGGSTQTGAVISWSPDVTATLWTTYKIVPLKLTVGGGARYISSQTRSSNNDPDAINPVTLQRGQVGLFEIESYTVVDAMASYEATKNVTVQLNAYNLFDEDYVQSLNNSGLRYKPGEPLSYLASVILRF
ncbi:catecholate siderophore receptor Fiu [Solimonas sp. K1W22B-7]|uniref:catecholate siderophore receptor Fiu n=1 Tax=Solimonas sp. K1W22B-7 TaxID=2303331 RepID=UPI000E33678F|nr:catecholate siderophore receptor Fiu [Solimonas sp. K1W22B-7]AXQ29732.1 catecholate siderophore receptor Fiu [Solimonas sp. K1W22B-7]